MMRGTSASAGIGIGKAVVVVETELKIKKEAIADPEAEKVRFQAAVKQAIEETEVLAKDLAARVGPKDAEILNGHLLLFSDMFLMGEIENIIAGENVNSEYAIENVCNTYADTFASMGNELMQQRATDMHDIKTRMQKILMEVSSVDISSLPEGSVIVAKDLTPSMTA
ncbi:phosphoenolpyruvate-utilizing N-terminal domain-containing protein, partial [Lacrimispora sp.]|uniref:phosphoenolpyruvate-utilizing N-terminal domain-containing protein n=1 Tax=Lacrimispora sp. TaxID=2719234 RepID=UPI002FD94623